MKLNWNSGLIIFRSGKSSRYDQAGRPVLLLPNRSMQCHELTHCVTPVSGPFPGACLERVLRTYVSSLPFNFFYRRPENVKQFYEPGRLPPIYTLCRQSSFRWSI